MELGVSTGMVLDCISVRSADSPTAAHETHNNTNSKKVDDPGRFERHGMKVVGPPLLVD